MSSLNALLTPGILDLTQASTHFYPIVIAVTAFSFTIVCLLCITVGKPYVLFFYNCFLKPHAKPEATGSQQGALESFYQGQAAIYDATRGTLLQGRVEMLKLAMAQLNFKAEKKEFTKEKKPGGLIWVDV